MNLFMKMASTIEASADNTTGHIPAMKTATDKNIDLKNDATDILFFTMIILLFALSLYVFVVLCVYLHRFLQKRKRSRAPSAVRANGYGNIALSMRFVVVAISAFCLIHFIAEEIFIHLHCCKGLMEQVSQIMYGFVMICSYLFFWLRQRVLYDAPAMRLFNSVLLRVLSWLSLAFVAINGAGQIILTCLLGRGGNADPTWVYLSWLVGCVIVQGTLMSLFLYPLLKHRRETREMLRFPKPRFKNTYGRSLGAQEAYGVGFGIRDSNIFTVTSSRNSKGSSSSIKRTTLGSTKPMYRAARRCVVCAAVAFVSDVMAGIFMIVEHNYLKNANVEMIRMFLFDLNLVVNSVFVVGCFSNWRFILFPRCFKEPSSPREQYGASSLPEVFDHQCDTRR